MDLVVMLLLVGSFALFLTSHVALAVGLFRRPPRWRGALALLIAPLALYWGLHERMRLRTTVWMGSLTIYVVARFVAGI